MNNFFLKLAAMNSRKAVIFGFIALSVYYFALYDDGSAIDARLITVRQQIAAEEKKQKESENALKEVEQIRIQVAALSDQYKLISSQIPTDAQMADFLKLIDSMASTSGVNIRGKEPKPAVIRDHILEEMPIRVSAEGTYSELTLFLYKMMQSQRISRVLNFTINLPTGKNKSKLLTMESVFANYRFVGDEKLDTKAKSGVGK